MHLLIPLSIDGDVDHHRRKDAGYRGGREQDVDDEGSRAWVAARGDGTDVPDHRAPLIQIGRQDQQQASFAVLFCEALNHAAIDERRYAFAQGRGIGHRVVGHSSHEAARLEDIVGAGLSINLLELFVVLRPEKREGRRKRAGADAGYDCECRAIAACGPADEQSRAVSAVVAAAGDGEKIRPRLGRACLGLGRTPRHQRGSLAAIAYPGRQSCQSFAVRVGVQAGVGDVERYGVGRQREGNRRKTLGGGATGE